MSGPVSAAYFKTTKAPRNSHRSTNFNSLKIYRILGRRPPVRRVVKPVIKDVEMETNWTCQHVSGAANLRLGSGRPIAHFAVAGRVAVGDDVELLNRFHDIFHRRRTSDTGVRGRSRRH